LIFFISIIYFDDADDAFLSLPYAIISPMTPFATLSFIISPFAVVAADYADRLFFIFFRWIRRHFRFHY